MGKKEARSVHASAAFRTASPLPAHRRLHPGAFSPPCIVRSTVSSGSSQDSGSKRTSCRTSRSPDLFLPATSASGDENHPLRDRIRRGSIRQRTPPAGHSGSTVRPRLAVSRCTGGSLFTEWLGRFQCRFFHPGRRALGKGGLKRNIRWLLEWFITRQRCVSGEYIWADDPHPAQWCPCFRPAGTASGWALAGRARKCGLRPGQLQASRQNLHCLGWGKSLVDREKLILHTVTAQLRPESFITNILAHSLRTQSGRRALDRPLDFRLRSRWTSQFPPDLESAGAELSSPDTAVIIAAFYVS